VLRFQAELLITIKLRREKGKKLKVLSFSLSPFSFDLNIMTTALKHYLNPLHVYCRLRDMGIGKGVASVLCRCYEKMIFRPIAGVRD
jgi:hypothetical protein